MLNYKGFRGYIRVDYENNLLYGEVTNIVRDTVTFQGASMAEAKQAFEKSIDEYLEYRTDPQFTVELAKTILDSEYKHGFSIPISDVMHYFGVTDISELDDDTDKPILGQSSLSVKDLVTVARLNRYRDDIYYNVYEILEKAQAKRLLPEPIGDLCFEVLLEYRAYNAVDNLRVTLSDGRYLWVEAVQVNDDTAVLQFEID